MNVENNKYKCKFVSEFNENEKLFAVLELVSNNSNSSKGLVDVEVGTRIRVRI